jgi:multisubunit Na+/H+ antiporter MnhG subunit
MTMTKMLKQWGRFLSVPALSLMTMAKAAAADGVPDSTKATFGDFMTNIQNLSYDMLQVIIAVLVVVGIAFVVMGALKLKQNHDQPNQGHAAKGFVTLLIGIVLLMPITMTKLLRNTLNSNIVNQSGNVFDVGSEGVTFDRTSKTATGNITPDDQAPR